MKDDFNKYTISSGLSSSVLDDYRQGVNNSLTPMIIEENNKHTIIIDVFSKLMSDRILYLGTGINDYVANVMNAQLLYLSHQDPTKPITIYINSPGGSVYAGMGIYDTMKFIEAPIYTINTGIAASMGAVLLAAGDKGNRKALKHSRTMIHQPMSGAGGQASDIEIVNNEIQKIKKELYTCLANDTGQDYKTILKDGDRDYWMTATEAKKYGMIDIVNGVHKSKVNKKPKAKK